MSIRSTLANLIRPARAATPDSAAQAYAQGNHVDAAAQWRILAAGGSAPTQFRLKTLGGVRVLVVDDSILNLEVTKRILELHGAKVHLAGNGKEAVECLRKQPHEFDIVLMDVQMPLLDGYEATRKIRGELGLVHLPIIALTAGALSSERQRAMASGMDDFIVKPINASTLAGKIQHHTTMSRLQPSATHDLTHPSLPIILPWPAIEGIDPTDARLRLCGDFGLFRSSLVRLLEEFPGIEVADIWDDVVLLRSHASHMHKLSGCAGTLGANAIQRLAVDFRSACIAGDFKHLKPLAKALDDQLKRLHQSAAPVLEAARVEAAAADEARDIELPSYLQLQPQQLAGLIEMTRKKSLAALQRFAVLAPQLRRHLGKDTFETLRSQMENLRFSDAAIGLTEAQTSLPVSAGLSSRVSRTLSSKVEIGNGFSSSTVSGPITP